MEFLGVGPLELMLVIILALVLVGPRDLAKFAREAGRFINKLYRSQTWRTMNDASREIRNLPNRLAREAELDTLQRDLEQAGKSLQDSVNAASKGVEKEIASASQGLENDLRAAGEGMKAWTAPAQTSPAPLRPTLPPGPAPASPAPGEKPPAPPNESPFAEG
jgi:sec-independent protein translocase protein TatB